MLGESGAQPNAFSNGNTCADRQVGHWIIAFGLIGGTFFGSEDTCFNI